MPNKSLIDIFLEHSNIDDKGFTELIFINDLIKIDSRFQSNNGCQWARKGSKLDNKYNLIRFHANELGGSGNKVVAIQLQGFKSTKENHSIPAEIKNKLKNKPCAILGVITSDMEIDHKNGKYNSEKYTLNDFQPLSKAANDAKREHCKKCNNNKSRFDAKILGYNISYTIGDEKSPFCEGCYWYDPFAFNQVLIKGDNNV